MFERTTFLGNLLKFSSNLGFTIILPFTNSSYNRAATSAFLPSQAYLWVVEETPGVSLQNCKLRKLSSKQNPGWRGPRTVLSLTILNFLAATLKKVKTPNPDVNIKNIFNLTYGIKYFKM